MPVSPRCQRPPLVFRKSSYSSGNTGNCVEVALSDTRVHVRDSKDLDRSAFRIGPVAWAAFLSGGLGE
ncbi:DUF397 domain-containing protein [Streptomyces sp. SID11385]|uniref:DUF397 domain-containing protein n=1 Tax=Streptomyces sp. SID11385 TaxID=2706031 RepID=UPI0013CA4B71|nr:DUF397 domain-containing protein [Streptomyces sp. SID11385]NEA42339.1 DUF397 domain-containing protein [Streptomyces sp. SID11385]